MKSFATLSALAALVPAALANLDIVTLTASSDAYIQEVDATLVLPAIPDSTTGDASIWSAIMMENEASFLQGVSENAPSGYVAAFQQNLVEYLA